MVPMQPRSNGMAVASLILGILSLILCWIPGVNFVAIILAIVAIILGILGMKKAKEPMTGGRGMAIGGLITGILGLIISILILAVLGAIFGAANEAVNEAVNNPDLIEGLEELASELGEFPTE